MQPIEIFLNRLAEKNEIFSEISHKLSTEITDVTSLEKYLSATDGTTEYKLYVSDEKNDNPVADEISRIFAETGHTVITDEFLNIIDDNDRITDNSKPRSLVHRDGELHPTVHVWLIRRRDMGIYVLLQKRSSAKDIYPDLWDVSSAGHVRQGQEYGITAVKETREELGLEIAREKLEFLGFRKNSHIEENIKDNELTAVFMCREVVDDSMINSSPEEVSETGWAEIDELISVMNDTEIKSCISVEELAMIKKAVF